MATEVESLSVASRADVQEPPVEAALPAPLRWLLALPLAPGWVSAGVGVAYLALSTVLLRWLLVEGSPTPWEMQTSYALYCAFVPLATASLAHGSVRDARALAPHLGQGESDLARRAFEGGARAWPLFVAAGLAVALFDLGIIFSAVPWSPWFATFLVVREVILCIAIFGAMGWAMGVAHALSQAVADRVRVDLLDVSLLAPLARCGSRLAFWWLALAALGLPLFAAPPVREEIGPLAALLGSELLHVGIAAVSLALPMRGARDAIRREKRAELARVRKELHAARGAGEEARLPGLLAWERRIEATPEWPIDAETLGRTGLYLLIPVAGWTAGALVEHLVDRILA